MMRLKMASIAAAGMIGLSGLAFAGTPAANYPVFFQPWSAAIDANGASTIALAAKTARANPTFPVIVTGSADTVGGETANQDMAQTRAQVVADALVADGVSRSQIALVSTGALAAPGAAPGSFSQFSRRVLIKIGN
jgi:outer membrane protein OmpA-like peptidoglycan-associated protein